MKLNPDSPVSAVIPTYDRAHLLGRAVDSVLKQTAVPREIIVVDDGSHDGTARLVAERYPTVTCIRQPHRGVSAARNRGVSLTSGSWIAFLDSDDEWLPAKLELQLRALHQAPESRVCHTEEIWTRRGRRLNPGRRHAKQGGWIYERCLPLCVISPSSVMIHRRVFTRVGGFDETLPACEDYDLWLRITSLYPVLFVDTPLVRKYGGHADQLSHVAWGLDRFRIRALEKMLAHGRLTSAAAAATRETLLRKIDIYVSGALKRGKRREAAYYLAKRARHAAVGARP